MSFLLSERESLPSTGEAQRCVYRLADSNDYGDAAALACWMILDKGFSMAQAKRSSARKFDVTQAGVERLVRQVIPQWFFDDRQLVARPSKSIAPNKRGPRKGDVARRELEGQRRRHLSDI